MRNFISKVDQFLKTEAEAGHFSGAVRIQRGDEILFNQAYGYANRTWRVLNTPATRFRIASVGKLFTAVAVLQMLEAGKITLEDRIHDYLPLAETTIPPEVTIYQLLTMTSGIADWINENSETFDEDWQAFCRQHPLYLLRKDADYLPIFGTQPPYTKPGEKHAYCGAGFMLLGLLIEKLSGLTYFDVIRQQIFKPADMQDSDFLALDDVVENVAEGYIPVEDEAGNITKWLKNYYATTAGGAADGGSTASLDDMVNFSKALRSGSLISLEAVQRMTSPQVIESEDQYKGFNWHYGFGCFVLTDLSGNIVRWGHTGEEDGVSCRLWHYPQQGIDVVILGNQSGCAGKASWEIQAMILGQPDTLPGN